MGDDRSVALSAGDDNDEFPSPGDLIRWRDVPGAGEPIFKDIGLVLSVRRMVLPGRVSALCKVLWSRNDGGPPLEDTPLSVIQVIR